MNPLHVGKLVHAVDRQIGPDIAWVVGCAACGARCGTRAGYVRRAIASRLLKEKGWTCGGSPRLWRCPKCPLVAAVADGGGR